MRWVFYTLLIVNLVYGGWKLAFYVQQPADTVPVENTQSAGVHAAMTLHVVTTASPSSIGGTNQIKQASRALCVALGPWDAQSGAQAALRELGKIAAKAVITRLTVEKPGLSWVYLPPYPDKASALAVLKELQSKGIDSFITDDNGRENAISLGYFHHHESAIGLQQHIRQAGYPAKVRNTTEQVTEYWLIVDKSKAGKLAAYQANHADLMLNHSVCQ